VKLTETISEEETLIRDYENSLPTFSLSHTEWVRSIRGVYEKDNVLNREQFKKACMVAHFNLEEFKMQLGTAADDLEMLLYKSYDLMHYNTVLQLSILLTEDDEDLVPLSKIETFVLSLCGNHTACTRTDFEDAVNFMLNVAIYILPQGVRIKRADKSAIVSRYISTMQSTIAPLTNTLLKMFFGSNLEIPKLTLYQQLKNSKEGHTLMSGRKIRVFAYKKYESTMKMKEIRNRLAGFTPKAEEVKSEETKQEDSEYSDESM